MPFHTDNSGSNDEDGHFIHRAYLPTTEDTTHLLLTYVFHLHGLPDHVILDQGSHFISWFWWELFCLLEVCLYASTAYHTQSDSNQKE